MIILFTLWYILGWQFPVWLWVLSGLFYIKALKLKKGKTKKKPSSTLVLPFYLALAIIFGKDGTAVNADGSIPEVFPNILPPEMSFWTIIGILIASFLIRLIISRPDQEIKKQMGKKMNEKSNSSDNVNFSIGGDEDELKLHINVRNKEKEKNSNFTISLENGFIKEMFVRKVVLKGMKKGWESNSQYKDDEGNPFFDLEEIYNKAKKNPVRGEILSIDNDKVTVTISIK